MKASASDPKLPSLNPHIIEEGVMKGFSKVLIADLQILGAAFFFGIGFIGQRAVSMDGVGPMTCNAFRFALSTIIIIICMPWIPSFPAEHEASDDESSSSDEEMEDSLQKDSRQSRSNSYELVPPFKNKPKTDSDAFVLKKLFGPSIFTAYFAGAKRTVVFWGIILGILNFFASGFQQWGIAQTTANKVAFIAGFDLVWVPVLALFVPSFKRNGGPTPSIWVAVAISIAGIYLLSGAEMGEFDIGPGETLVVISTFFWTLHITYTDIATNYVDSMHMMCVQLGVVTFLSTVSSLIWEPQSWFWHHILSYLPWLLFLAVSEGLGFTLMAMGQSFAPPTHAAILLSLEGVFTSLFSYLVLGETLSLREKCGCLLMLGGTALAEMGLSCLDGKRSEHGHAHGSSISSASASPQKGEHMPSSSSCFRSSWKCERAAVSCGAVFVMIHRLIITRPIAYFRDSIIKRKGNEKQLITESLNSSGSGKVSSKMEGGNILTGSV